MKSTLNFSQAGMNSIIISLPFSHSSVSNNLGGFSLCSHLNLSTYPENLLLDLIITRSVQFKQKINPFSHDVTLSYFEALISVHQRSCSLTPVFAEAPLCLEVCLSRSWSSLANSCLPSQMQQEHPSFKKQCG